ncbi:radical SAM protein [Calditrichota bacterium GD2]
MHEARISITPFCNYRCFFCHNEGLTKKEGRKPHTQNLRFLISRLLDYGYNDLTFTGGEPFIYSEVLIETLHWLQKTHADRLPAVTIVSNGSLIQENHVAQILKYPKIKFHISLHTASAEKYPAITRQKRHSFSDILKTLQILAEYKAPYKMNYVLLRGVNNSETAIWSAVDLAARYGARAIKFLELLVMENNEWLYPYFFDVRSAEAIISKRAPHFQTHNRRKVYRKKRLAFDIELQQLTCKIGCAKCLENRDHTFSAALQYFPCMEASDVYYNLKNVALAQALKEGKKIIANLAQKYGKRSPSLIQETRYTKSRKELFFSMAGAQFELFLKKNNARLLEQKQFNDWYYRPRTADSVWESKQRVIKIRQHVTDERRAKIIGCTVIMDEIEGLLFQRTLYLEKDREIYVGELENARKIMEALDMVCWFQNDLLLKVYLLDGAEVTVSAVGGGTVIVGLNAQSFSSEIEMKAWLKKHGLKTRGEKLLSLLQKFYGAVEKGLQ